MDAQYLPLPEELKDGFEKLLDYFRPRASEVLAQLVN